MIERLIDTWLSKANERSFQIPFAHSLAFEGHTVIHMTRHCSMELGKDIISIDPNGVPCAYQLKGVGGKRMSLAAFRRDLSSQLHPLVHGSITHPSIKTNASHHRSFIVINGDLDEEVQQEISHFNLASARANQPDRIVETIVKGELFERFMRLQGDFWATNLEDIRTYLELFLEDGRGQLPKEKLATLLSKSLPLDWTSNSKTSKDECIRKMVGAAIICASAISSFSNQNNHGGEFEAWTLTWCHYLATIERYSLSASSYRPALNIASDAIFSSLGRLCDELMSREALHEGDPLVDYFVYRTRLTYLLGLVSVYGLWLASSDDPQIQSTKGLHLQFAREFVERHLHKIELWGEYMCPQVLAVMMFRRTYDATLSTTKMLVNLIEAICKSSDRKSKKPIPNAYWQPEKALLYLMEFEKPPTHEDFGGHSRFLESFYHLFVRENFQQHAKMLFPEVSRFEFNEFMPETKWEFFLYRNRDRGQELRSSFPLPMSWRKLRDTAAESNGVDLPQALKDYPVHYLCLLLTMPHRASSSGIRWLNRTSTEPE